MVDIDQATGATVETAGVARDLDSNDVIIDPGGIILTDNEPPNPVQVTIHEAMQQQAISICKAGIQAMMNAQAFLLPAEILACLGTHREVLHRVARSWKGQGRPTHVELAYQLARDSIRRIDQADVSTQETLLKRASDQRYWREGIGQRELKAMMNAMSRFYQHPTHETIN
ncbi:minichromosome maintenance protein, putative [Perkinsus marinus ATCC 50983]|uniref:Minichromosome maintenance protein, putative n=1 Tax=Perkinsus marinus (strain ATCC 50983 / TXsc) TaxID=423536 RepID=C5KWM5_PERM5|nr:minichromosome maintenance protein, putative [Perkinsus marinus ATCC 50983]EER11100.1 minichromosome maintenance protein, putative [Perkinsus marinus ATCC 50983]|eukprot:XP_002779305.1 minichromosome maintenance protein, putative [Perkinsus marinus ATCC 50983]